MAFEAQFSHGKPTMLDYTPGAAVAAGTVVVTNDTPRVAHLDIPANTLGAIASDGGVYRMVADGAIAADKKVYFNVTTRKVSLTATGAVLFGVTEQAAAADLDAVTVRHDPGA